MTLLPPPAPTARTLVAVPAGEATPRQASPRPLLGTLAPLPGFVPRPSLAIAERERLATAIVFCEANSGAIDGKTANGARSTLRVVLAPRLVSTTPDAGELHQAAHGDADPGRS
jgi:hypothetical protein